MTPCKARERVVLTQKRLLVPIEELRDTGDTEMADLLYKSIRKSIAAIEADLKKIKAKIMECLKEDNSLHISFPW